MILPKTAQELIALTKEEQEKVDPVWINALSLEALSRALKKGVEENDRVRIVGAIRALIPVTALLIQQHDKIILRAKADSGLDEELEDFAPASSDKNLPN